jgi:hypothetical protein
MAYHPACGSRPARSPLPTGPPTAAYLGLTLSLLSTPAPAAGEETVGFVLEQVGEWQLDGKRPRAIAEGDGLPAGGSVRPKAARPADETAPRPKLIVCLYTGKAKVYTGPATLPGRRDPMPLSRIWAAVSRQPMSGYIHPVSRGIGIPDGVVKLNGGVIDPARAFRGLAAGEHGMRFDPIAPRRHGARTTTIRFAWDPEDPHPIPAGGLRPGLYRVTAPGEGTRPGEGAWILLSAAPEYDRAARSYREAYELSENWDGAIGPHAVIKFRRAYLKALAEHPES